MVFLTPRHVSFSRSGPFLLLSLILVLTGCASRSSMLRPATDPVDADPEKKQVLVEVLPIDTYGFGNKQKKRLGLDVSAYFSAFEVSVRNRTDRVLQLSPSDSRLRINLGTDYPALTPEKRKAYYQTGGREGEPVVIIPKSSRVSERELQRIEDLALREVRLGPGEDTTGLIYFKKVTPEECTEVDLILEGIILSGEEQPRRFEFSFSCPPRR